MQDRPPVANNLVCANLNTDMSVYSIPIQYRLYCVLPILRNDCIDWKKVIPHMRPTNSNITIESCTDSNVTAISFSVLN